MTLAAVLCCAMTTEGVLAQNLDLREYLTVETILKTNYKFTIDFNTEKYDGDQLRAGIQSMIFSYTSIDEVPILDINPDELVAVSTFSDIYGREIRKLDCSEEVGEDLGDIFFVGGATSNAPGTSFSLAQGGVYVAHHLCNFMYINKKDTVTVYDDPSLRIRGNAVIKAGENVDLTAYYNTGFPYDINSLTGEEYSDVTIYKMLTDTTGVEVYKNRFPLHLKDEAHPLLAGIDSIKLRFEKPEVGKYLVHYESNWSAVEDRNDYFYVHDTLRAAVKLDKEAYDLATDKQARMTLKMDYRYPHIYAFEPDVIPTIRVAASLLKDSETKECLMTDTLTLASDTLTYKDLDYVGEWDLDLSMIDQSNLDEGNSTYQLKVSIKFNNEQQYETFIPVDLKSVTIGISPVATLRTDDESIYTLSGVRKNSRQPLAPGIYLRKGNKIIIK